jgi:DNA helicase-2/ATP-dependent DNA helicase PcrA
MSRLPDAVRDGLPDELADAEIAGVDVADVDENVRLWGPPGTGKSTQSALRTATRAEEEDIRAGDMTIVTYRKSLAGVVRRRLLDWGVVDEDASFDYWATIHAAASRATDFHERFPPHKERDDLEGMVDRRAEFRFCKKLGLQHTPSRPWEETKWTVFRDLYNYSKNNLLDVGTYENVPKNAQRSLESDLVAQRKLDGFFDEWGATADFHAVADGWEDFKNHHGCYDFFAQLDAALGDRLPPMKHVVIDEYHDATPLMAAVTERWVRNAETAIVAGDPDQVVNGYAGADPGFFEDLGNRTDEEIPVVKLDRSWRCPDLHFEAAARVLSDERPAPALTTAGAGKLHRWPAGHFEADENGQWVFPGEAEEGSPAWLWNQFGDDMLYLTRTRKQANGVAAALDAAGIIYRSQNRVGGDWDKRLRLLSLLTMLESVEPPRESTPKMINGLTDRDEPNIDKYSLSVREAELLAKHSHGHYIDDRDALDSYLSRLNRDTDSVPLTEWNSYITPKWWLRYTNGAKSIDELTGLSDRDRVAMQQATDRYDLPVDVGDVDTRVLTIHASKGVEADNVVVYDGITGQITDSMDESDRLAENEARTWYVALTRASKRLHILRNAFDYTNPYLPQDLEPRAAASVKRGGADD